MKILNEFEIEFSDQYLIIGIVEMCWLNIIDFDLSCPLKII